jgi:hypothetical protein
MLSDSVACLKVAWSVAHRAAEYVMEARDSEGGRKLGRSTI